MTPDPARRRGRRDNGLDAAAYVPLADVDPRVGEHLLDVLWAAGVPAYLEPSTDIEPTRALTVPSPPVDRLWVDRERRADARTIVENETPRLPPSDDDRVAFRPDEERAWRQLVAEFGRDSGPAVKPWPAAEDLDVPTRPTDEEARPAPAEPQDEPTSLLDGLDSFGADIEDLDEGHYEPPPPPPMPRLSRFAVLALAAIALGASLLFAPDFLQLGGSVTFAFGVLLIVSGVGLLVWRLREDRDEDGPDDGAIV
jgi:hypothetical protein